MDCSYAYFSVFIKHYILGQAHEFDARASKSQELEIAGYGDDWRAIDKATLFAWMWFETAQPRTQEGLSMNTGKYFYKRLKFLAEVVLLCCSIGATFGLIDYLMGRV